MNPDRINALFELGAGLLLTLNVARLYKDKKLAGVSLFPTAWFNLWGAWNLHYYHALHQPLSWYAGWLVFAMNTAWVGMAVWYREKKRYGR